MYMTVQYVLQKNKGKSESSWSQYDLIVKMKVIDSIICIHDILILFAKYINFDRLQITF